MEVAGSVVNWQCRVVRSGSPLSIGNPEMDGECRANRPHYHLWLQAATGRIFYKVSRGFHTRQAARQYGMRRQPDAEKRLVLQCFDPRCAPKLPGEE